MITKLYTVDNDGVEHEVSTSCAVAELKPATEYPEKEQFVRALKGLQSVSVECEVTLPDDVAAELRKRHATWNAIRAALWKLRRTCSNCRFMLCLQRKHGHIWLCRFSRKRISRGIYELHAMTCPYFRRKCKSKP